MKKKLSLLLALVLMLSLFAACGGGSNPTEVPTEETGAPPATQAPETEAPETEEPAEGISFPLADTVEMSIALPLAPFANSLIDELNDWVTFAEMEKITNVVWDGQLHPALNALETFAMMLSSGDWADVMANLDSYASNGNFQCYQDEIIIDLTDLIAEYAPNIQAQIDADKELELNLTYEGTDGGNLLLNFPIVNEIPTPNQESGLQYRGDWLEALDMSVPITITEFEAVMDAFKTNYDSKFYIGYRYDAFTQLATALNVRMSYDELGQEDVTFPLYVVDGVVKCGLLEDEALEYFTVANRWYNAGYVDPDFYNGVSNNIDAETARAVSGEFGIYAAGLSTYSMVNGELAAEGGGYMVAGPSITDDEGSEIHIGVAKNKMRGRGWAVSSTCENPEIVCAWVDYLFSDEGYILYNYGIENETFDYVNGEPVLTDLVLNNPEDLPVIMTEYVYTNNEASHVPGRLLQSKNLVGYSEEELAVRDTWLDSIGSSDWKLPRAVTLNIEENETYNELFGDILTYFLESGLSFVTGAKSLDEFDSFRDQLRELGMDTVVELYQQAYDRYVARAASM